MTKNRFVSFAGLAALLAGLAMLAYYAASPAAPALGSDHGACSSAEHLSVEGSSDSISFSAPAGTVIAGVCIKSGENMFGGGHSPLISGDYNDGCYVVDFNAGMTSVTVTRVGSGPNCQGLSHIDVDASVATSPTATSTPPGQGITTPTATAVPPTATQTTVPPTATPTAPGQEPTATATSVPPTAAGTTAPTVTLTPVTGGVIVQPTSTPVTGAGGLQGGGGELQQEVQGVTQAPQEGVTGVQGVAGATRLPGTGSGGSSEPGSGVLVAGLALVLLGGALASSRLIIRD
ncbi:MAG TPA: hypothetical protein VNN10_08765 [Dehalococcoidia bacterium]|nr:hypothetical protein [Dehalococcoidia bacterium]